MKALQGPLDQQHVSSRSQAGRSLSYLETWHVRRQLIAIFGYGGFSAEVIESSLAFEEKDDKGRWNIGYKVTLKLTLHELGAVYTESAVGSATLPQRGEAHDMAIKSAESDALKRAAVNLGSKFGLGLYDNGSLRDVVAELQRTPKEPMTSEYALNMIAAINDCTSPEDLRKVYEQIKTDGHLETPFDDGSGDNLNIVVVDRLNQIKAGE
jgi:recombination DNA repair RAD52 pathway protein